MCERRIHQFLQKREKLAIVVLILIGFILYANALPNKMFWDDDDFVLHNGYIKDWRYTGKLFSENVIAGSGLQSNYWRPFLLLTYAIEWHLWGNFAPGFHFTNIALHIANAVLLFFFLKLLFKKPLIAYGVALIFLIHPLQTEAVTYVSSRGDALFVFFILLGLVLYTKSNSHYNVLKHYNGKPILYFCALGSYVFALLSKEIAIILPFLLFLVDLYRWQYADLFLADSKYADLFLADSKKEREHLSWKHFFKEEGKRLLPFLGIAFLYGALRATVLNFQNSFNLYNESNYYTEHLSARVFTFFRVLTAYIGLFFLPIHLHMEREVDIVASFEGDVLIGFLLAASLLAVAFFSFRRKPEYSFSVFWFLGTLFPFSGILIPINGIMYEHWLYLPMIGFFSALGFGIYEIAKRLPKFTPFITVIGFAFIIFFSFQTINRNATWRDPITLYNDILRYTKGSVRIWNNLGMAYADAGEQQKAIVTYKKAIELDSTKVSSPPHHNLANTYKELGDFEEALKEYKKAIAIDKKFLFSYYALANLYLEQKQYDKATDILERALAVFPNEPDISYNIETLSKLKVKNSK